MGFFIRNLKLVEDDKRNELSFETNMTPFERNKFRKILLTDLSVVAVDKVLILSNKTLLTNEQLVHRIGLLPVDPKLSKVILEKDKCDCEKACEKCALYCKFDISFDSIKKNIVYSNDISPLFYRDINVIPIFENRGTFSGIIKLTRKSPKLHYRWSLPVTFSFEECNNGGNNLSNNVRNNVERYTLSSDLPYDLLEILYDVLVQFNDGIVME